MVTTSDLGCAAPTVTVTPTDDILPYTLTVTSTHDANEWSTGETTASIVVRPHWDTWYWVRAIGPGGCDEAAVALAPVLFADDFEDGNTGWWTY